MHTARGDCHCRCPDFVPLLEAVGGLDKVIAKVGEFPPEIYTEPMRAALERIRTIGNDVNSGQGVEISLEAVLAASRSSRAS